MIEKNKAIILILIFALGVRLYDIKYPLLTFDEEVTIVSGFNIITGKQHAESYLAYDSPPLGRIYYGAIVLFSGQSDIITAILYARVGAAILGTLTIYLAYAIAQKLYSKEVAIYSALILSTLPLFVAHNRIAALETPLAFLYSLTIYVLIRNKNPDKLLLPVVLSAMTFMTKYFGITTLGVVFFYYLQQKKDYLRSTFTFAKKYTLPFFATIFALWPYLWNNTLSRISKMASFHIVRLDNPTLWQTAKYLFSHTFATVPVGITLFFLIGAIICLKRRNQADQLIAVWFFAPYSILLIFLLAREHIRYFFPAFVPFAIICAVGLAKLPKKKFIVPIFALYLIFTLAQISPYYLNYYSELVGGSRGVYESQDYQIAFWGSGLGEAMVFLKETIGENETTQLYVEPNPKLFALESKQLETPTAIPHAQYLVFTTNCVVNGCVSGWFFDYMELPHPLSFNLTYKSVEQLGYENIFEVNANGAVLSRVYLK